MAGTESTMLDLGTRAPDFSLPEPLNGGTVSLAEVSGGRALVIAFICNHCPYVIHIRAAFAALAREYQEKGVKFVAINSNDVENYADDSPDKMIEEVRRVGYTFPYLYDPDQSAAKAYQAACTPDFYLFDDHQRLVYRGQFDASRPKNTIPVTGEDLRGALDTVLAGGRPDTTQTPSMGCNIKWKAGNEPAYFA